VNGWLVFTLALAFQGVLFWLLNRGFWPYEEDE
jgi:hypothetical protein